MAKILPAFTLALFGTFFTNNVDPINEPLFYSNNDSSYVQANLFNGDSLSARINNLFDGNFVKKNLIQDNTVNSSMNNSSYITSKDMGCNYTESELLEMIKPLFKYEEPFSNFEFNGFDFPKMKYAFEGELKPNTFARYFDSIGITKINEDKFKELSPLEKCSWIVHEAIHKKQKLTGRYMDPEKGEYGDVEKREKEAYTIQFAFLERYSKAIDNDIFGKSAVIEWKKQHWKKAREQDTQKTNFFIGNLKIITCNSKDLNKSNPDLNKNLVTICKFEDHDKSHILPYPKLYDVKGMYTFMD